MERLIKRASKDAVGEAELRAKLLVQCELEARGEIATLRRKEKEKIEAQFGKKTTLAKSVLKRFEGKHQARELFSSQIIGTQAVVQALVESLRNPGKAIAVPEDNMPPPPPRDSRMRFD